MRIRTKADNKQLSPTETQFESVAGAISVDIEKVNGDSVVRILTVRGFPDRKAQIAKLDAETLEVFIEHLKEKLQEIKSVVKKAKFIKELRGFTGDAYLYELSESVKYSTWIEEDEEDESGERLKTAFTSFVVVSGCYAYGYPETYIFPSDSQGKILNWGELIGSFQGDIDHKRALSQAGFQVVDQF